MRIDRSGPPTMLKPSDFFQDVPNQEMKDWLYRQQDVIAILNNLAELFAKLDGQVVQGEVDEHVSMCGPIHIGKGSRIHPHVTIDGPCIIGENVSVRSHAQIRRMAFVSSDCVIGHGADVKFSLCLDGAKIQDGTFVGDSVLGRGCRIGSGAILANRKFNQTEVAYLDWVGERHRTGREFLGAILGDYVRIGANAVLSPGTIVGPHTWVGSGVVLQGTHAADLLIVRKQDLDVRKKDRVPLRSGKGEYEYL